MASKKFQFKMTPARIFMILFLVLSLGVVVYRFTHGMGTTNLNDEWPWGLWIIADLSSIALAGVGFSMTFMTHIIHREEFEPLSRRALLMSLAGYVFCLITLLIEIGRWENFYQPFIHPGIHSPLFEVLACITVYVLLQSIEFVDASMDLAKDDNRVKKALKAIMPFIFVIAAIVPFGHQSSLGALYLAMPQKLDPLWSSSMLPWFFLASAFFVGFAVSALEYIWATKHYGIKRDVKMVEKLLRIGSWIMLVYFIAKVADIVVRGQLGNLFAFDLQGNMYLLELVVGVLIPVILGLSGQIKKVSMQIVFGVCTSIGVILSRVNVIYVGMLEYIGTSYVPNWVEIIPTIGFLFLSVLIYLVVIENLPFFGIRNKDGETEFIATKDAKEIA